MAGPPELTWGVLLAVLAAATLCDLRSGRVPAWLTGGGIAAGVLLAAWAGPAALVASLGGALAGGLIFLPFVWRGWLGGADAPSAGAPRLPWVGNGTALPDARGDARARSEGHPRGRSRRGTRGWPRGRAGGGVAHVPL